MAREVFANESSTTVQSGGISAPAAGTTETWTVASNAGWPTADPTANPATVFHVRDADLNKKEQILVTDNRTLDWQVTRGVDGTAPVIHQAGFTIEGVTPASVLQAFEDFRQNADFLAPIGVMLPFAGPAAPAGWLLCQGQAVSRTAYPKLFAAIGTAHGSGDGSTTFNLPDMRQRLPLGVAAAGTGSTLGGKGGAIDHGHGSGTANHNHTVTGHTHGDPGHSHGLPAHNHGDSGHGHGAGGHSHSVSVGITDYGHSHSTGAVGLSADQSYVSHGHTYNTTSAYNASYTTGGMNGGNPHGHNIAAHSHSVNSSGTGISASGSAGIGYEGIGTGYAQIGNAAPAISAAATGLGSAADTLAAAAVNDYAAPANPPFLAVNFIVRAA